LKRCGERAPRIFANIARKFEELVHAQGGDLKPVENLDLLPRSPVIDVVPAGASGYIERIDAHEIGLTAMRLGAGRVRKGEAIDFAVGVVLHCKVGDPIQAGEPLFTIHARRETSSRVAAECLTAAVSISSEPTQALPLFYETILA
jgi:pyrimidine-nucleoside phosphorylase